MTARPNRPLPCRHFNGIQHDECRAGVKYSTFRSGIDKYGFPGWLPCLSDTVACDSRVRKTQSEKDAEDAEFDVVLGLVRTARASIINATKNDNEPVTVECPKCGETLRGVRHSNGHVHAQCETEGCLRWME